MLYYRILKGLQHFRLVVIWQAALFFGEAGLFQWQAITPHDFVGQLLTAEQLFAGINGLPVIKYAQRGHGGANVYHSNGAVFVKGQLVLDQRKSPLHRVGLYVHYF